MKTKNKAFTLVEILLAIGITSLAAIGLYVVFKNASETSLANEESKNLMNVISRAQRAIGTTMSFSSINTDSIGQIGGFSSRLNLTDITSPNPAQLSFNYTAVAQGVCGKLISSILSADDNLSASVNGQLLKSDTAPDVIASSCSSNSNAISVIVGAKSLGTTLVKVNPTPPPPPGAIAFSPTPVVNFPAISTIPGSPTPSAPAPVPVPGAPSAPTNPPAPTFSCAPGQTQSGYVCISPPPPMIDCVTGWTRVGVVCEYTGPPLAPASPAPSPAPVGPSAPSQDPTCQNAFGGTLPACPYVSPPAQLCIDNGYNVQFLDGTCGYNPFIYNNDGGG